MPVGEQLEFAMDGLKIVAKRPNHHQESAKAWNKTHTKKHTTRGAEIAGLKAPLAVVLKVDREIRIVEGGT